MASDFFTATSEEGKQENNIHRQWETADKILHPVKMIHLLK